MQKLKLSAGSFLTALFLFPAFSQAQTVSIVSGNGQLICQACPLAPQNYAPLVVQVKDAHGNPVANTAVIWTATQPGDQPVTSTSLTGSTGQATYTFAPLPVFAEAYFFPATVVASALNASVQFVETTALPGEFGTAPVSIGLVTETAPPTLTGPVGQTAATPIKVDVLGVYGPLPNVSVSLQTTTGSGHPTVSCATQPGQQPGTVLTDATGTATCNPVFGGPLGTGLYSIAVGGTFATSGSGQLTVTQGPPSILKLIGGNNQTVSAGVTAPLPLSAEVTDLFGDPSNQAAVTWSVSPASDATLTRVVNSSPGNGIVTAYVTPTAGPVTVTVSLTGNSAVAPVVFTVNVNTVVTGLTATSGTPQQIKQGLAFPEPLIVQANDNALPVPGVTVTFAVSPAGAVTLSGTTATTNTLGQVQVTATAGANPGLAVITASLTSGGKPYTATFDLTILPLGPIITAVKNSAGFQDEFVSPCSLATIYGSGLAAGLQGVAAAFIEPQTQVAGVTVQFGSVLAPILDVANVGGVESVSVQVPCEVPSSAAVPPATVPMVVTAGGAASTPFGVTVLPISPGIFQFTDSDGKLRAVLVKEDGSFVSVANPAHPGDTLRMFVTGLGQTTPGLFTNEFDPLVDVGGNLVPQALPVNASLVVGINNSGVLVLSAKYAYGMVGVYEVDFQVPADTATGNNAPFAIGVYQNQGTKLLFGNPSLIPIQ